MAGKLGPYLQKLATDPQELKSFKADAGAAMQKAGLDQSETAALKSKDPAQIKSALGGGAAPADLGIIVIVA